MKIAIASGKGGTGKTTTAVNLAYLLSEKYPDTCLADCDVEEPDCQIFLNPDFTGLNLITRPIPVVDNSLCTGCKTCATFCKFNAMAVVNKQVIIFEELCHSCGGCKLACPLNIISENDKEIGIIETAIHDNLNFVKGKLKIGEVSSPALIKKVKNYASNYHHVIIDCPPGTSCPVIHSIDGVDFVILVTEPTPFGLYDLKLAVETLKIMNLKYGIVINKSSKDDYIIEEYACKESIKILTKIKDDLQIAKAYSRGELIVKTLPETKKYFLPLVEFISKEIYHE